MLKNWYCGVKHQFNVYNITLCRSLLSPPFLLSFCFTFYFFCSPSPQMTSWKIMNQFSLSFPFLLSLDCLTQNSQRCFRLSLPFTVPPLSLPLSLPPTSLCLFLPFYFFHPCTCLSSKVMLKAWQELCALKILNIDECAFLLFPIYPVFPLFCSL